VITNERPRAVRGTRPSLEAAMFAVVEICTVVVPGAIPTIAT
jgi:hypothetical protein